MSSEDVCQACGSIVKTPLKCSQCNAAFHMACVKKKKNLYVCPQCGHKAESYALTYG
ncbi:MAG: hypothetical protein ACFE89_09995 [Candidatus Hodarchaeota archaeon]